jgi:acetyl-CoA carboxylase biotin carboxyl carrier protein
MKNGGDKQDKLAGPKSEEGTNVFNLKQLRQLIRLMENHDLSEINLRQGDERVQLRRGPAGSPYIVPTMAAGHSQAPAPAQASASAAAAAPGPKVDGPGIVTIKAPMVGTFYARPNPKSEAFVKVGQRVTKDTVLCIIEAMKVFNEIPAEVSGEVVAVLMDDQQAVDFDRPLFKIDTTA